MHTRDDGTGINFTKAETMAVRILATTEVLRDQASTNPAGVTTPVALVRAARWIAENNESLYKTPSGGNRFVPFSQEAVVTGRRAILDIGPDELLRIQWILD